MWNVLILLVQFILFASCYKVEIVRNDVKPLLGEMPHWDAETNSLYYIDLMSNNTNLYRYDFGEKRVYTASIPNESGMPGFITPIEGRKNKFAVGLNHDFKIIKWDGKSPTAESMCTQFTMDTKNPLNRIHDSRADPFGNFYGGVPRIHLCSKNYPNPSGNVFKSIDGEHVELLFPNIDAPNGMAWDTKKEKFFFTNTCTYEIWGYNWDPKTTKISNPNVVFNYKKWLNLTDLDILAAGPDGMTIDTDGFLYSAIVNGSSILKINPDTSEVVEVIKFPVPIVQAPAFGGPNLDILFATTSNLPLNAIIGVPDTTQKLPPDSGSLYMVTGLGAKGFPGTKLRKSFASCAPEKSMKSKFKGMFKHGSK